MVEAANCSVGICVLKDGRRAAGVHLLDAEDAAIATIHFNAGDAERLWRVLGDVIVDLRAEKKVT